MRRNSNAPSCSGTDGDPELRIDLAYAILERGALGLVEIVRQMPIRPDENVLIVVDQFEELFRYAQTQENTAAAFVKLLLEATSHPDLRLYVVLTMRSDFLGDCAAFADLPERINRGLYLVPRMTRDQLEAAIVGPVKVARSKISPALVNRLLNDVGDDPDQLPVLAHALMLTYDLWAADHGPDEPIDERHYRATGGLAQAIDVHAERIYATLTPKQQAIADKLFAAITELGPDNRGIRRPLSLEELCAVCDADEADVRAIVEAYRARTCSFLRPPPEVPLTPHTIVDISHEALMRGWSRLERLLTEEVESARTYGRLSDAAQMYAIGKGGLLTDPSLTLNLNWREEFKPTQAWANRYGGDFPAAMGFLERSAKERAAQREARRAASRRRWTVAGGVMAVLAVLTFASVASFLSAQKARTQSLISQSHFLARDADAATDRGDAVTGMLLALEALPQNLSRPDRPFFEPAQFALMNSFNQQREIHDVPIAGVAGSLDVSPDEKRILVGLDDRTARVYDAATNAQLLVLRGHQDILTWAAYSPDGRKIVTSANDKTARIWDAGTGAPIRVLRGHRGAVNNAVFSNDGKYVLTASNDKTAQLWNAATGAVVQTYRGHTDTVSDAEFSPDGSQIITAGDRTLRIWDRKSGVQLRVLRGHRDQVISARFSPDGHRIASGSTDNTAIVWDAKSGAILFVFRHEGGVSGVDFSHDGKRLVTTSNDNTARIWDLATGAPLVTLSGHTGNVVFGLFTKDDSRVITSGSDRTVRTWRVDPVPPAEVFTGHRAAVYGVGYSPDGKRLVTGSANHTARVWNVATGKLETVLRGPSKSVASSVFSPDGSRILTASEDGTLRLWDTSGHQLLRMQSPGEIYDARFSPDGKRIVSAGRDPIARIWDARTGALLFTLRGHTAPIWGVRFSPDGKRVSTASEDRTARIWNAENGKAIRTLRGHQNTVMAGVFSGDGKRLLTPSVDGTARIYDIATGTTLQTFEPDRGGIVDAAFSPDGSIVALSMWDEHTVRLFDTASGSPIDTLRGEAGHAAKLSFSPDGKHLASASGDKTARVWTLPSPERCQPLIDEAQKALPRQISEQQRTQEYLEKRAAPPLLNTFASAGACR